MKAIIISHVPPARTASKNSWDETCWQKYALWNRQFRDVIVGSLYGHMNIDHFMLQDFEDISHDVDRGYEVVKSTKRGQGNLHGRLSIQASGNYLIELRNDWDKLPKPLSAKGAEAYDMFEDIENPDSDALDCGMVELIENFLAGEESGGRRADVKLGTGQRSCPELVKKSERVSGPRKREGWRGRGTALEK